ncbi:hypothetical protein D3C73_1212650 [compost metagenome]
MPAVLGDGAGGFQGRQATQGGRVNPVANALITTLEKVFLHRFAHFQQHRFQVHLMTALHPGHGQFHHHHRRALRIILDRTLATDTGASIALGNLFDLPAWRPGHHRLIGISLGHNRKHTTQENQRPAQTNHCNQHPAS